VQSVTAQATIEARATQALSRFDLDFDGDSVQAVSVDGRSAGFTRQGEELVVTLRPSPPNRRDFTVQVAYTSGPRAVAPDADLNTVRAPPGSPPRRAPTGLPRLSPYPDFLFPPPFYEPIMVHEHAVRNPRRSLWPAPLRAQSAASPLLKR
jgi:hypothetical protein